MVLFFCDFSYDILFEPSGLIEMFVEMSWWPHKNNYEMRNMGRPQSPAL